MKENIQNKRAYYDYFIEDKIEAGIVLEGWEVKSIRAKGFSLSESYAVIQKNEIVIIGMHINPNITNSISTHTTPDPLRTRKVLLHKKEISNLIGLVKQDGYTLLPLRVYFSGNKIKIELGLGKGKKSHDKRNVEKQRDWDREKSRLMKKK